MLVELIGASVKVKVLVGVVVVHTVPKSDSVENSGYSVIVLVDVGFRSVNGGGTMVVVEVVTMSVTVAGVVETVVVVVVATSIGGVTVGVMVMVVTMRVSGMLTVVVVDEECSQSPHWEAPTEAKAATTKDFILIGWYCFEKDDSIDRMWKECGLTEVNERQVNERLVKECIWASAKGTMVGKRVCVLGKQTSNNVQ